MAWNDLTIAQRSQLMNMFRHSGITDLTQMRQTYDSISDDSSLSSLVGPTDIRTSPAPMYSEGGTIHIKPENRGKFTALKERTGHSATWFKEHGTPAQKKMAIFALNAKHWKHAGGGLLKTFGGGEEVKKLTNKSADFTPLPQRRDYNIWKRKISEYKGLDTDDPDYDYKGFYYENPDRAWRMLEEDPNEHFTDKYKTASHPTLSNESIYAEGRGGAWGKNIFELSDYLMENSDKTVNYLRENDPEVTPTYKGGIVINSSKVTAQKKKKWKHSHGGFNF